MKKSEIFKTEKEIFQAIFWLSMLGLLIIICVGAWLVHPVAGLAAILSVLCICSTVILGLVKEFEEEESKKEKLRIQNALELAETEKKNRERWAQADHWKNLRN